MNNRIKNQVVELLTEYPEMIKKIALLRYELEHPANVSPDEMLEAMAFAKGMGAGKASGSISNKTLYIALNYREEADKTNAKMMDEITLRLIPLERKVNKLNYYLTLLDDDEQLVIRLCFFEGKSIQEAADELAVSVWSVRKRREDAISKLAEMYTFVEKERYMQN